MFGGVSLKRIQVYVYSARISTLGFVDKEGAQHACARAGSTAFSGLQRFPGAMDDRYLTDEERNAIILVESFCKHRGLEYEVVDLAGKSFLGRMKFMLKGVASFPVITFEGKTVQGIPTEQALEELVTR